MSTKKLSDSHDIHNLVDQGKDCSNLVSKVISHNNDPELNQHLNGAVNRLFSMIETTLQSTDGEPKPIGCALENVMEKK